jgi:hypothetical protein
MSTMTHKFLPQLGIVPQLAAAQVETWVPAFAGMTPVGVALFGAQA